MIDINKWFTIQRTVTLDFQKMEDLSGIDRGTIAKSLKSGKWNPDDVCDLEPLLKMIESGFTDCDKDGY